MKNVSFFDGKMFMWDGKAYETREAALDAQKKYQADGFETQLIDEEGACLVYTRRVAAQQSGQ
jgi:hypothetical protein